MSDRNYELDYAVASKVEAFNNPRDVRALTEDITVDDGDASDEWTVHSASGRTYTVNTRLGRCSCYDHENNGEHCKHLRAVTFLMGQRPITTQALFLDDVAAAVVAEDNEVDATKADIDDYAEIQLSAGDSLEPRTKWVDADGELVAESQPDAEAATEPEPGDAIDAERALVAEQEPDQQAAADGGQEAAICGAETADGGRCRRKGHCPYHGDDADETASEAVETDAGVDTDADADAVVATDGGTVDDVVERVIGAADTADSTVVVVINT